ncbi:hypothetical protein J6590_081353 [Homalodisca vitripennis]|nr:hypothetical protein J6590_081353 [Homalodisca vitripennis]
MAAEQINGKTNDYSNMGRPYYLFRRVCFEDPNYVFLKPICKSQAHIRLSHLKQQDVGVRCCKIGGVGWVRKDCSKGDETVDKGLLEERNVVNGSAPYC